MAVPSDTELQFIAKLKDRLQDDLKGAVGRDEDEDLYLLRFLRARDCNLNKSEEMIRKHLLWRNKNDIENILSWKPPQILPDEFPYEISGFDKEGCPVLVVPIGTWDVRKICEMGMKSEYVRYVDQLFGNVVKAMKQSSKVNGRSISQFICIFVPDGLCAFRQVSSAQAVDSVLETVRRFEANYPETLKAAFVVDAPKVFQVIYAVVKPLVNSRTLSKATIASNPRDWKPALLELVSDDQLSIRLGGTRQSQVEVLNAPKGGDVPQLVEEDSNFTALNVPAGKQMSVEYAVEDYNTQITWSFKTDKNDIGFSVLFEGTEIAMPYKRVNSHEEVQCGGIKSPKAGKYVLVFDNTFSRFRSKTVRYRVVIDEADEDTESCAGETSMMDHHIMDSLSICL